MILRKQHEGMTLLEVMLVLVIGATIMVMGFRLYQSIQLQSNVEQVQGSVDMLLNDVAHYYQAICKYNPSDPTLPNLLPPSATPKVLNMPVDLQGYLSQTLVNNPLLDTTTAANSIQGYYVQLNPMTPNSMNTYACWNFGSSSTTANYTGVRTTATVQCSGTPPSNTPTPQAISSSQVLIWKVQVAVKLRSTLNADTFRGLMAADCTSTLSGSGVAPCSANTPGQYLVWERLPSLSSTSTNTGYWLSKPALKQFNRQYTNDQMYELSNPGGTKYYSCGG